MTRHYVYYGCVDRCGNKIYRREVVEEMVRERINEFVYQDTVDAHRKSVALGVLEEEREEIEGKFERLSELYVDGNIDKSILDKQSRGLQDEYDDVVEQIDNIEFDVVSDEAKELLSIDLDDLSYVDKKMVVDSFVKKVIITNESVEIEFI